jgi:EF hand domain-containing protein
MIEAIGSYGGAISQFDPTMMSKLKRPGFEKIDKNENGSLDKTEVLSFVDEVSEKTGRTIDGEKLFDRIDTNQDGLIDKEEFKAGREKAREMAGPPQHISAMKGGKKPGDFSDIIMQLLENSDESEEDIILNSGNNDIELFSNSLLSNYTRNTQSQYNSVNPLDLFV